MQHRQVGETHLLKLEPGDEVIPSLVAFAREHGIRAASLTAIGAIADPVLGYFDVETKEYLRRAFEGSHEMVALTGNLAMRDGEPILHAHVAIGAKDFQTFAGHLFGGTISATGEFFIRPVDTALERRLEPEVGLPLWDLRGS